MGGQRRKPRRDMLIASLRRTRQNQKQDRKKGKASGKNECERGGTRTDIQGVKKRHRIENVLARPNGPRDNAETAISCRGPGPARKKKEICQ